MADEIDEIDISKEISIDILKMVEKIIEKYRGSETIEKMLVAQKYFLVENEEILLKEDSESLNMSNEKLTSALYRMAVEQKVNYAFNNEMIFNFDDLTEVEENPLFETYKKEFEKFMSFENRNTIIDIATEAINKGIGYAYVNVDENGKLILQNFESETIYPLWDNRQHNSLIGLARDYNSQIYQGGEFEVVNKIDYFDKNSYYNLIHDGSLEFENDTDNSHLSINGRGSSWERVPFVWLKANQNELPLLNLIKSYLDAYDLLNSRSVDTLIDDIDPILILENMSSDKKTLEETRELLKDYKIASLPETGKASYLTVKADISAIQEKTESLYKAIMQYSSTVDTNDVKGGTNNSGVALKAMYQNLDIWTNGFERQIKIMFSNIKYFFDMYLSFKNIGNFEAFQDFKINVKLDRDMLINEAELIKNTSDMQTLVSQQTLDEYNPLVFNHENEQKRREEDIITEEELNSRFNYNFENEENDVNGNE